MYSLVRARVRGALLFQIFVELVWIGFAMILAGKLDQPRWNPSPNTLTVLFVSVGLVVYLNHANGFYRHAQRIPFGAFAVRESLRFAVHFAAAYIGAKLLLGGNVFPAGLGISVFYALCLLFVARQLVVWPVAQTLRPRRTLILGTGPEAHAIESSLGAVQLTDLEIVGFFPLDRPGEIAVPLDRIVESGGGLQRAVTRLGIDEVVVALREQRGGMLPLQQLLECRLTGVQVTDMAGFVERIHGRVPLDSVKVSWLIFGKGFRQTSFRKIVKRAFDLLAVSYLLVLAAPLMALTALVILLTSGMPIIYRQERVGYLGRRFTLLKFRSMVKNAESDGRARWARVDDERVTRFGRFLRLTRIDELPQLMNVLKGEMSLVGPRPERPSFVKALTESIPFYSVRNSVQPGITGWAQVSYGYGGTVAETARKLEYDLYYVKNHSLALDLRILARTVAVVLRGDGAR